MKFEVNTISAALIICMFFFFGVNESFCQGLTHTPMKNGSIKSLKAESVKKCVSTQSGSESSLSLGRLMEIGKKFSFGGFESGTCQ